MTRLKYNCSNCHFSQIQHFRNQIIGEPYGVGENTLLTVNYRCPECGSTSWSVNQDFTITEKLYQSLADSLGKLGVKHRVFSKSQSVNEWIEEVYQ